MIQLYAALVRISSDLDTLEAPWALIGGLAVSARAEPRTTVDVDLAVAVRSDREAEALVRGLVERGYSLDEDVLEHESTGRLATVRLHPRGGSEGGVVLDLMFAFSGVEPEIVKAAEVLEIVPGLAVPLATPWHLVALKVLAGRPQDWRDGRALLERYGAESLELSVRETLDLISRRGCDQGRDLQRAFTALLAGRDPAGLWSLE